MLNVDVNEPYAEALKLLNPVVECQVKALNTEGWADYMWEGVSGFVHVERKQWGEVLSGMDKIEDQLRRELQSKPGAKLVLIIEGLAIPHGNGTVVLRETKNERILTHGRLSAIPPTKVYAWLYQIQKYFEVYQTSTYTATCMALCSMYRGDQKSEHTTMQRHFKDVTWNPNPQVTSLMGLLPGVGEKRATELIREYVTVWNVLRADPKEIGQRVPGVSETTARRFLARIGRTDV